MSRKGENIYKRKDGRWEGRYLKHNPDGPRYGYVYGRSYREVKNRLREASARWAAQPRTNTVSPLLREVAMQWLASRVHQVKDSTLVKYHGIVTNHLLPALGEVPMCDLTHSRIEAFSAALQTAHADNSAALSACTAADVVTVLRSILRFAVRNGVYVPCDGSTVRIARPRTETHVLSYAEENTLCAYILNNRTPETIGILLSLYTGLRVGEICGLRWEDIDLDEGVLHVRRTVQRLRNLESEGPRTYIAVTAPKSSSSRRTIPLPEDVTAILTAMPVNRVGWFLTDSDTRIMEPRRMQHQFRRIQQELGLAPTNFHTLRHTFATRCVELEFDAKALSEVLGHSTVTMTMDRYVHPTMARKRSYMERLRMPQTSANM